MHLRRAGIAHEGLAGQRELLQPRGQERSRRAKAARQLHERLQSHETAACAIEAVVQQLRRGLPDLRAS